MWLCHSTPCGIPEFRELWELWEEMWLCRYTPCGISEFRELWEFWEVMLYHWALWNSGIPGITGILGRDDVALMERVCHMSLCRDSPFGIPEFRELWEFWEEMSYHRAL